MIVPDFWAEAKIKKRVDGRQVTVKRFGWSDESIEDAQQKADSRAEAAMALIAAGKSINRFERKLPYNGSEGVPIREEIVKHIKDSVITRNSYGALCINTPDVLFADIDFQTDPNFKFYLFTYIFLVIFLIVLGFGVDFCTWTLIDLRSKLSFSTLQSFLESLPALSFSECLSPYFWGILFGITIFTSSMTYLFFKLGNFISGGVQAQAKRKIKKFSKQNPAWNLQVYRTPAGYRVLVLHKTFDPNADETLAFFRALDSDPIYVRMCKNQRCFRARVSPKPWRIGLDSHMKPSSGVWPISPERMPDREKWIEHYDRTARNYASCRFEEHLGSNTINAKAEYIRSIHDKYCKAKTSLTIA